MLYKTELLTQVSKGPEANLTSFSVTQRLKPFWSSAGWTGVGDMRRYVLYEELTPGAYLSSASSY